MLGHFRSCLALVQLGESQGAEHDPNRLDSAAENVIQLIPVPFGQTDMEATINPHD
jgi:hypothetical protein